MIFHFALYISVSGLGRKGTRVVDILVVVGLDFLREFMSAYPRH